MTNDLLARLAAWEAFLASPTAGEPISLLSYGLDQAFGYRVYRDDRVYPEEVDDLAARLAEVRQVEAFYQHHSRLQAVARYAAPDFVAALPATAALSSIKTALQQAQTLLSDAGKLKQFIASEVSLLTELLEPAEAAIESYGVRYLQLFDQVITHTEQIRQQIEALRQEPAYLALTHLAQVPALGADSRPALAQTWTQALQGPPELFPTTLTHAAVKRDLRAMPHPPGCPLTLRNAGDWLQRADDTLNCCRTALSTTLRDKAALLHSPTLRERLEQGRHEPFIAGLLAAPSVEEVMTYLAHTLSQPQMTNDQGQMTNDKGPRTNDPISLLNRYLKKIKVRKLRLVDFTPGRRTVEPADVDQIVAEFRQFLLTALEGGSTDELPVVELE